MYVVSVLFLIYVYIYTASSFRFLLGIIGQISIEILAFSAIISMAKNDQIANILQLLHLGPGECMLATL
jgi:hypothetical protein